MPIQKVATACLISGLWLFWLNICIFVINKNKNMLITNHTGVRRSVSSSQIFDDSLSSGSLHLSHAVKATSRLSLAFMASLLIESKDNAAVFIIKNPIFSALPTFVQYTGNTELAIGDGETLTDGEFIYSATQFGEESKEHHSTFVKLNKDDVLVFAILPFSNGLDAKAVITTTQTDY